MARGRRAALPGPGAAVERGLLRHDGRLVVRCFEEETGEQKEFDFTGLPLAPALLAGMAEAFARRVAPGAGLTRLASFEASEQALRRFAEYLATLAWPPREVAHLTPEHLEGFLKDRRERAVAKGPEEVAALKRTLAHAEGLSEAMLGLLGQRHPKRARGQRKRPSYTVGEFGRIAEAARADLRAAARRIRENRTVLERWRAGEIDTSGDRRLAERMELLRWADEYADVPRYAPDRTGADTGQPVPMNWVSAHGTVVDVVCRLHLNVRETASAAVLMAVMTGQNVSVIAATPAAHHRADGYTGSTGVAITRARKHRRARHSHMDLVWSEVPDWISIPEDPTDLSTKDELHTPFGLYMLLHELTARSRAMVGTDRLLVHFTSRGARLGLRTRSANIDQHIRFFAADHELMCDKPDEDGNPIPLELTLDQVRMTHLEFNQKPVAHTGRTLATTYLLRNHGNLAEYQQVVASALAQEVDKARARGAMLTMTATELARAEQDPEAVATEYGIDAGTLKKMIAGQLDTVMNACVDNLGGHHGAAGEPCRASFMQCLECPCARALPRHLPVQILVHDRIAARKTEMPPLAWAERFAAAHSRLTDILDQHGQTALADARDSITTADQDLVGRFFNRELDLR